MGDELAHFEGGSQASKEAAFRGFSKETRPLKKQTTSCGLILAVPDLHYLSLLWLISHRLHNWVLWPHYPFSEIPLDKGKRKSVPAIHLTCVWKVKNFSTLVLGMQPTASLLADLYSHHLFQDLRFK